MFRLIIMWIRISSSFSTKTLHLLGDLLVFCWKNKRIVVKMEPTDKYFNFEIIPFDAFNGLANSTLFT